MKNDQAASASLSQAVGRSEERHDVVGPVTLRGFAALLDLSPDEARLDEGLPPLWHWGLFQDWVRPASIGDDGHPRRGGFLPAIEGLDSRMFAGGRLQFLRRLRPGEAVTRRSIIREVKETEGGAGRLVVITVEHRIGGDAGDATIEEQDLVFRAAVPLPARADLDGGSSAASYARGSAPWPVLLPWTPACICRQAVDARGMASERRLPTANVERRRRRLHDGGGRAGFRVNRRARL
jgi:hydroxyacyl-ACP dehydratase HTD2-like protein with hotdog domain